MTTTPRPYHHGNLREAMVEAGLALARTGGPEAVQLRAVSRQAGVSHSAGYRHFATQEDLLREVGRRCMVELADLMARRGAAVPDPLPTADPGRPADPAARAWEMLRTIGRAYVEFAVTEPGWFRTGFAMAPTSDLAVHGSAAFDSPIDLAPDPATGWPRDPFATLSGRLDDLVTVGAIPAERRPGAEFAAWSLVHGLSSLLVDGPLRGAPRALVDQAVEKGLDVVARGL